MIPSGASAFFPFYLGYLLYSGVKEANITKNGFFCTIKRAIFTSLK